MKKPTLDDLWKRWLEENLERECDPHELVSVLLHNRFSLDSIRETMGEKFPAGAELLDVAEPDYRAISETRLTRMRRTQNCRRWTPTSCRSTCWMTSCRGWSAIR